MNSMSDLLKHLYKEKKIRPLDYQFAKQMSSLCGGNLDKTEVDLVMYIAALVSYEYSLSNICVTKEKAKELNSFGRSGVQENIRELLPDLKDWDKIISNSGVFGNGNEVKPLVYDGERFYLYRNWKMETEVANSIRSLSKPKCLSKKQLSNIKKSLDKLFARNYDFVAQKVSETSESLSDEKLFEIVCELLDVTQENKKRIDKKKLIKLVKSENFQDNLNELSTIIPESYCINWQKVSAASALTRQFTVISGGPGTGKTTTVSKLLAALIENRTTDDYTIKLCAPTGKAAARLSESISKAMEELPVEKGIKGLIPTEASTIHRLLGAIYKKADFRHNRKNKLHLDVLVVDEASMIDLSLMSKLIEALPDNAVLILLGDKDQLASVEAGSVLGDICGFIKDGVSEKQKEILDYITNYSLPIALESNDFTDALCVLRKSYRFHKDSGVGQLAYAVNSGKEENIAKVINKGFRDIDVIDLTNESYRKFLNGVSDHYSEYLEHIRNNEEKLKVLTSFNKSRLLCATREGECGITTINEKIETILESRGLISRSNTSAWYVGRPVMITKNDHSLGLYNGDIGICMRSEDGKMYVYFEAIDGGLRRFLPSRLPINETIYAMTIHKSQGSEFEFTYMLLPDKMSPIMTRELVYTGITRAKGSLKLCCIKQVLNKSSRLITTRSSGLSEALTN